jgi:GTP-binding protein
VLRRPALGCRSFSADSRFRNVAIVAHVDHGKTTLVDQFLQASSHSQDVAASERAMDSGDIERERGITIMSKVLEVTRVDYDGCVFNIVDTPGHQDFGGGVERV